MLEKGNMFDSSLHIIPSSFLATNVKKFFQQMTTILCTSVLRYCSVTVRIRNKTDDTKEAVEECSVTTWRQHHKVLLNI